MMQQNEDIRREARIANIPLWKIGEELGYTDSYFSRKMRKEFLKPDKEKVMSIIQRLSKEAC